MSARPGQWREGQVEAQRTSNDGNVHAIAEGNGRGERELHLDQGAPLDIDGQTDCGERSKD